MTQHLGRPRDEKIDARILQTTLKLLHLHGYAGLRIDEVAAESQVAKTTIYRRWPTLARLAVAAIQQEFRHRIIPPTGDVTQDIDNLIATYADIFSEDKATLLTIGLDIHRQSDSELQAIYRRSIIDPIRCQIIDVARHQRVPEQHAADLTDAILGGLMYRTTILNQSMTKQDVTEFIINILKTCIPIHHNSK